MYIERKLLARAYCSNHDGYIHEQAYYYNANIIFQASLKEPILIVLMWLFWVFLEIQYGS